MAAYPTLAGSIRRPGEKVIAGKPQDGRGRGGVPVDPNGLHRLGRGGSQLRVRGMPPEHADHSRRPADRDRDEPGSSRARHRARLPELTTAARRPAAASLRTIRPLADWTRARSTRRRPRDVTVASPWKERPPPPPVTLQPISWPMPPPIPGWPPVATDVRSGTGPSNGTIVLLQTPHKGFAKPLRARYRDGGPVTAGDYGAIIAAAQRAIHTLAGPPPQISRDVRHQMRRRISARSAGERDLSREQGTSHRRLVRGCLTGEEDRRLKQPALGAR